jgi:hypothetical protein
MWLFQFLNVGEWRNFLAETSESPKKIFGLDRLLFNGSEPERAPGIEGNECLTGFRILIGRQPLGANHNID